MNVQFRQQHTLRQICARRDAHQRFPTTACYKSSRMTLLHYNAIKAASVVSEGRDSRLLSAWQADRQRIHGSLQQPFPGGMSKRPPVPEPCKCAEKVRGLAQLLKRSAPAWRYRQQDADYGAESRWRSQPAIVKECCSIGESVVQESVAMWLYRRGNRHERAWAKEMAQTPGSHAGTGGERIRGHQTHHSKLGIWDHARSGLGGFGFPATRATLEATSRVRAHYPRLCKRTAMEDAI